MSSLPSLHSSHSLFFFFNDTATTEIYTLSLHDALPIYDYLCKPLVADEFLARVGRLIGRPAAVKNARRDRLARTARRRSEEHTSELQSQSNLVCRLLLEKKKKKIARNPPSRSRTLTSAT